MNKKQYNTLGSLVQMFLESIIVALMVAILILAVLFLSTRVEAETLESGDLRLMNNHGDMLSYAIRNETDVDIHVVGMIANVIVKQSFTNQTNEWVEGVYVFPLTEGSAVDSMKMHIGDRVIIGEIQEKKQAERNYQKALEEGKQATLVRQEKPNLFNSRIANIPPGESVTIEITYQQVVKYDNGEFLFRYPLAVTPRYAPPQTIVTQAADDFSENGWSKSTATEVIAPAFADIKEMDYQLSIKVALDTGLLLDEVNSRSHDIQLHEYADGKRDIELSGDDIGDRDFVLYWQVAEIDQPQAALFSENIDNNAYHLLMVTPDVADVDIQTPSREMIFVIDTSGSMQGESLSQAKMALKNGIERLHPNDKFNVIEFNSVAKALYSSPVSASASNIAQALDWTSALSANGGTEMISAMQLVLNQGARENDLRQLIFMTDGAIYNEAELFKMIETNLNDARLFTVGIGSAPNAYFMRKAAEYGRGSYTYIANIDNVQSTMDLLFSKLSNPILTNIQLVAETQSGEQLTLDAYPKHIPDAYAGEPLLVAIRNNQQIDKIRIEGYYNQNQWHQELALTHGQKQTGVAKLWARKKIEYLTDIFRSSEEDKSLKEEIIELSIDFEVLSNFTALVAVDKTPVNIQEAFLKTVPISTARPKGRFPSTATAYQSQLIIALLMMIFITLYLRKEKHKKGQAT